MAEINELVKTAHVDNLPAEPEKVKNHLELAEKISHGKIEIRGGLEKWELNPAQEVFVVEYLKNGMNGLAAAKIAYPDMSPQSAGKYAYQLVGNPRIAGAIKEMLYTHVATPDKVVGKLAQLSQTAKSEQVQHAATATLGKVWRLFSDGNDQQNGAAGLSVNFTLPGRDGRATVVPVDIEGTERPS